MIDWSFKTFPSWSAIGTVVSYVREDMPAVLLLHPWSSILSQCVFVSGHRYELDLLNGTTIPCRSHR